MSFLIEGTIKNYEWGKLGNNSLIKNFIISNKQNHYNTDYMAEIWYGTHELGVSKILNNNFSINSVISKYMDINYINNYGNDIPFIFKILTIMKPLSIQIHPIEELAKKLHKDNSSLYTDPNQKSEMALALSDDFELLYGFDNYENIKQNFNNFSQLLTYFKEIPTFDNILTLNNTDLYIIINIIKKELKYNNTNNKFVNLIKYLIKNFDYDVGILIAFYMKHICLNKGESIFIKPNTLHSYLKGDIIEIMNKSNNVIRLGLTKKYRDIKTIKYIYNKQTYNETPEFYINPILDKYFIYYIPPLYDFQIIIYSKILFNKSILKLPNIYPLIVLIIEGKCYLKKLQKNVKKGTALLILDDEEITNYSDDLFLVCATLNNKKFDSE